MHACVNLETGLSFGRIFHHQGYFVREAMSELALPEDEDNVWRPC